MVQLPQNRWFVAALVIAMASSAQAAESPTLHAAQVTSPRREEARQAAADKRRQWLLQRLEREAGDPQQRQAAAALVGQLTDQQVETLIDKRLKDFARGQQSLRDALAESARARQQGAGESPLTLDAGSLVQDPGEWQSETAARPGFVPVITWLPAGVSLTAYAVVSPGGRFVLAGVFPGYHALGPVYPYSYGLGVSWCWSAWGGWPWYAWPGYCCQAVSPRPPLAHRPPGRHRPPPQWYDGLRTHYGPRPRR